MGELQENHHNKIKILEPNLTGVGMVPVFSIGQRALLVHTEAGNVLWDTIPLLDEMTITTVNALGGISAIAISHPHFYSSMVDWAHAFEAPIYLHETDKEWVMRPDPSIVYWGGDALALPGNLTLIHAGGHFPGGTVMHWPEGAEGKGVLLTGDIINVAADTRYVSFMYSYPNLIPLSARDIRRIVAAVEPYDFDRIYSAWWDRVTRENGKEVVRNSAQRYLEAIECEKEPAA